MDCHYSPLKKSVALLKRTHTSTELLDRRLSELQSASEASWAKHTRVLEGKLDRVDEFEQVKLLLTELRDSQTELAQKQKQGLSDHTRVLEERLALLQAGDTTHDHNRVQAKEPVEERALLAAAPAPAPESTKAALSEALEEMVQAASAEVLEWEKQQQEQQKAKKVKQDEGLDEKLSPLASLLLRGPTARAATRLESSLVQFDSLFVDR